MLRPPFEPLRMRLNCGSRCSEKRWRDELPRAPAARGRGCRERRRHVDVRRCSNPWRSEGSAQLASSRARHWQQQDVNVTAACHERGNKVAAVGLSKIFNCRDEGGNQRPSRTQSGWWLASRVFSSAKCRCMSPVAIKNLLDGVQFQSGHSILASSAARRDRRATWQRARLRAPCRTLRVEALFKRPA